MVALDLPGPSAELEVWLVGRQREEKEGKNQKDKKMYKP